MFEDPQAYDTEYEELDNACEAIDRVICALQRAPEDYVHPPVDYGCDVAQLEDLQSRLEARMEELDEIRPPEPIYPADAGRCD